MATSDFVHEDPLAVAARISKSKNRPWFSESVGEKLTPAVRAMFEKYAEVAPEEVEKHIYEAVSGVFAFITRLRNSASSSYILVLATTVSWL